MAGNPLASHCRRRNFETSDLSKTDLSSKPILELNTSKETNSELSSLSETDCFGSIKSSAVDTSHVLDTKDAVSKGRDHRNGRFDQSRINHEPSNYAVRRSGFADLLWGTNRPEYPVVDSERLYHRLGVALHEHLGTSKPACPRLEGRLRGAFG